MEKDIKDEESFAEASVSSKKDNFTIYWSETVGLQAEEGYSYVLENIRTLLSGGLEAYGGQAIQVTPEGPYLVGDEFDAASVAWAFNVLYGDDLEISGDLPTMFDLGLAPENNFDKDGNPLVR
jgi:hypothetical protein